jgi:hypothetical protein
MTGAAVTATEAVVPAAEKEAVITAAEDKEDIEEKNKINK